MTAFSLDAETRQTLRDLLKWVRRFAIMYAVLWTTLQLAFFAIILPWLYGGR